MVVESHVTRQSLNQSPADQKARGFCLRDWVLSGGVRTTIAKHHGRYSKSDHLSQDGVE